ncbi:MAG: SusC/RagA family TonB-linked outer membrane protein [Candidatus Cryptobacteroides sp.]
MRTKIFSFFLVLTALCSWTGVAEAQNAKGITVSGLVSDHSGAPVIGASVVVVSSDSYAITDEEGRFSIYGVATDATIKVSCLGYEETTVKVNGKSVLDITINESAVFLEEAVAIGYGRMKKSDLTGSVASVKTEDFNTIPSNSIEGLMQGRVAGVSVISSSQDPGASSTVRIRGNSSINGSNAPLIVVDGFPYGDAGDLKQINPQDIVSMEVLKDASASAIYGSRGANGVILITTNKGGKKGHTSITIRQQTTISEFTSELNLWRDPVLMAIVTNESMVNGGQNPQYIGATNANGVYYPSVEELMTTWTTNTRWDDIVLRDVPVSNNTTVQVKSSTDRTNFQINANYYRDNGIYIKDSFDKFGGNFSVEHKIYDNFIVKASANITHNRRNSNGGLSYYRNPIFPVYDENGDYWLYGPKDYSHPLALTEFRKNKTNGTDVIAYAALDWNIIPELTLTAQFNYKHGETVKDEFYPKKYTEKGYLNNGFGQISNWKDDNIVVDAYATYDKNFAGKHHFTAMAGYSYEKYQSRSSYLAGTDFVNEALGNENLAAGNSEKYQIGNGMLASELVSALARVNYVYDNRYLFTVTARVDGSSKFGSGNKWAAFPSGAVSWNMHNEEFMKSQNVINNLKIRASYGISGNQGISAYQTLSRYGQHKYYYDGSWMTAIGPGYQSGTTGQNGIYAVWSGIANKNLRWETTSQFDVGFDISFFKNRLNITFDWYNKVTSDLLRERNIAPSSGYDKMWVNDGTIRNRGVELTIDGTIYADKDWKIGGTLVFSKNKNKVISLGNVVESGLMTDTRTGMKYENYGNQSEQFRAYTNILAVGQPMYVFYGYKSDGIIQTLAEGVQSGLSGAEAEPGEFKYKDIYNEDGLSVINENDRCIIGDPNPDWTGSFTFDVSWRNLDFSIFFNGVFGNDVVNTKRFDQPNNMPLRWTADNPTDRYPRLNSSRQTKFSDWWIEDGSFVRIQNISLGYTIPFRKTKVLDSIRVYVNASNLYTFTKFSGYDPEVNMQGVYSGGYPRLRKWTFGVDITF